jgi:bifunctional enzyme CysN/CysC
MASVPQGRGGGAPGGGSSAGTGTAGGARAGESAGAGVQPHDHQGLLRFITCGSVDDGKSTLIGRLLYESKMIFDDQLTQLEADSRRVGTRGGELDFALLVDGLAAEREQGITIDVAYRFFSTERRKFIVADTPGHEQYTRNMVTGASTAELAVILVDARKGVLTQTCRHSFLVHLLGIGRVVLAVNKMDLVGYSHSVFETIVGDYRAFAARIGLSDIVPIPVCAVHGDNIVSASAAMPWYDGPTLLAHLEKVDIQGVDAARPFRMPVQWVNRPNADFRGYAGTIVSGNVSPGDGVRALPSGRETRVTRILTADGDLEVAGSGQSVTLLLEPEIDVSRGDVIAARAAPPQVAAQFEATIVWLHEEPMLQGRTYLMKAGTRTVSATVTPLKHKINVNTLEKVPAERLELNDIGVCELELDRAIPFEPYAENRALGGFILIDRLTNSTVGAGLISFALRRSQNVHWQALDVDKHLRSRQKRQKACVLWLTGLSGAGKSTIANRIEKRLTAGGHHTYLLDGDNVRHGLNKDLGFTAQDRVENIRRVAEVAHLMVDAGLIVLVSFISPFRSERRMARALFAPGEFLEVFVDTPLAEAERRDVKGLYGKARRGELKNFTGIDSPYEHPENPEIRLDTLALSAEQAAERVIAYLEAQKMIGDV